VSRRLLPFTVRIALLASSHRRVLWMFFSCMGMLFGLYWYGARYKAIFTDLALVGTVLLPILLADVCADFRRGHAVLWMQRAFNPVQFYLARFAETTAVGAGLAMLFVGVLSGAAVLGGWGLESHPMLTAPWAVVASPTLAAVGFGLSAWLPGGARVVLIAFCAISVSAVLVVEFRPGLEEWFATRAVLAALFPLEHLIGAVRWIRGEDGGSLGALLRTATYAGAWTGLGALGVRRAASNGRMAGAGR